MGKKRRQAEARPAAPPKTSFSPMALISWPDRIPPTERIGKGMLLWYFPPEQSNQVSR